MPKVFQLVEQDQLDTDLLRDILIKNDTKCPTRCVRKIFEFQPYKRCTAVIVSKFIKGLDRTK